MDQGMGEGQVLGFKKTAYKNLVTKSFLLTLYYYRNYQQDCP
jgi:hypothetical protein